MRILALDAATEACSVSLWCDGAEIGRSSESGKSSAAQILSMVEQCLAEAQLALSALDAIASSIGPGAFTGVRISVAVAQGLAFGAGLAVIPITTLEALAFQVLQADGAAGDPAAGDPAAGDPAAGAPAGRALACLDARMGEVYWGCFVADAVWGLRASNVPAVSPPQNVVVPLDGTYQGIGRGFAVYPSLGELPGVRVTAAFTQALPQAREMGRLGALRLKLGAGLDPAQLTPLYLRDKVALTTAERAAQSH
jgi:tRNA threonylcarbamoyladenosine biosynthesis protein TsaB